MTLNWFRVQWSTLLCKFLHHKITSVLSCAYKIWTLIVNMTWHYADINVIPDLVQITMTIPSFVIFFTSQDCIWFMTVWSLWAMTYSLWVRSWMNGFPVECFFFPRSSCRPHHDQPLCWLPLALSQAACGLVPWPSHPNIYHSRCCNLRWKGLGTRLGCL